MTPTEVRIRCLALVADHLVDEPRLDHATVVEIAERAFRAGRDSADAAKQRMAGAGEAMSRFMCLASARAWRDHRYYRREMDSILECYVPRFPRGHRRTVAELLLEQQRMERFGTVRRYGGGR